MSDVLTLPRLGETMEEGRVVAWLLAPGEAFRRGDALVEVETDKTVVEVPALADGELGEILVAEGETVRVGDPIARLAGGAPERSDGPADEKDARPGDAGPTGAAEVRSEPTPRALAAPRRTDRIRATPAARRMARTAGLDLTEIKGSGRRGRVERADVEAMTEAGGLDGAGASGPPFSTSTDTAPQTAHGLAFRLTGPEAGQPLLLIHGFAGDHTVWAALAAGLAREGRRVLSVDLPGHGAATAEAPDAESLAVGLPDLVSATLGPSHIVAHSLGAVPARVLAEGGLARSLTLIAPAGLGHAIDTTFVRGLAAARAPGEVAHLLERMSAAPLPLSPEAVDSIAASLGKGRLTRLADAILGETGQAVALRPALARLAERLPVRMLAPHRDRIIPWQDALEVSPRIAVHHLLRAGHVAWWDAPQEVQAILMAVTEDQAQ